MPWSVSPTLPREAPLRAELYPYVLAALQISSDQYTLASLRYDLSKLRAKALVDKLPKSRRYRLWPQGYSICLVFLKLFERVYSPLTAGLHQPYRADSKLQQRKRTQLDRLYQKIVDDLDELLGALGLKAASNNENKICVMLRITVYAFSRTAPRKSGPFGAAKATTYAIKISLAL